MVREDDEVDPFDAFMEGIHEEMKAAPLPKPKEKLNKYNDDIDDDPNGELLKSKKDVGLQFGRGGVFEYDSDDNPIVVDKRRLSLFLALNHRDIVYESFNKDFYKEKPSISTSPFIQVNAFLYAGMSNPEVNEYMTSLAIRVSGFDVPRPIKTFDDCGFSVELMKAISKQGYEKPTPIQCQALPIVLSGRDIIGIAKTGSGKTAAFGPPIIVHIMDQPEFQKEEGPNQGIFWLLLADGLLLGWIGCQSVEAPFGIGVICAPTRELAYQIFVEAKKFSKSHGICVSAVYGGMSKLDQYKELKAGCEIVVATPGRLIDMIRKKAFTMLRETYLVLDEADRMFDLGFEPQIRSIVGQIRPDRQTLLFSATMPHKVEKLAREILMDPVRVTVGEIGMANEDVTQIVEVIPSDAEKLPWLLEYFSMGTLQKFKSGIYHVLIAIDVAVRGLDIKSLKSVVNYDIAKDMDMHFHRIGRTGRAGHKDGTAYTLITHNEARFAGELANSLVAAGQNVSMELMDLAMKDGRFWSKRMQGKEVLDTILNQITLSRAIPNPSAAVNSLRTGMMAQFKSSFVAASSNSQNQGMNSTAEAFPNKKMILHGFVSGGTIGGDSNTSSSSSTFAAAKSGAYTYSHSKEKSRERRRPSGWDR
ncbi:unnamed protein product [Withania somnifera]